MIRPFHLRDLALVYRLSERGVVFQTQAALTSVPHPVRRALAHMLVGGRYSTYVWKSDGRDAAAFIQLGWQGGNSSAHLVSLGVESPDPESGEGKIDEGIWLSIFDQLAEEAGQLGVYHLVAEAAEDGPELPVLRKAGFAVYTRQDIWVCDQAIAEEGGEQLQPRQSVDDWDINVLYANTVPGLIHSVEPSPPLESGQNWILREGQELAAFINIEKGEVASWMRVFIHPNASTKPTEIIKAAIRTIPPSVDQPMYCCVRRYQSWVLGPLAKAGFKPFGSQAVLVKHLVQPIRSPVPATRPVLEAQAVTGSTPLIRGIYTPEK